jgi:hypothetical protein
VDTIILGQRGPWSTLEKLMPPAASLELGITKDRQELRRLNDAAPSQKRVLVVGSSRANAGFQPDLLDSEIRRRAQFGKVAHAYIAPFEISSLVDEAIAAGTDVVVIVLSEFDVNRPVFIVAPASFGSFTAVWDLARLAGPAFANENRGLLFQLSAVCTLNGYRYRHVLQRAFADEWLGFELVKRFPRTAAAPRPDQVEGGVPTPLTQQERKAIFARLDEVFPGAPRWSFHQVRSITRGPHSDLQRALIRRTVTRLRAAGVATVIVEAPIHPLAVALYDTSIRSDFLAFVAQLMSQFGVGFVSLENSGPYAPGDFRDLTHLGSGAAKLTRAIEISVAKVLRVRVDERLAKDRRADKT